MHVRAAGDEDEVGEALALRDLVFCGEQGVAVEAERDGRDTDAVHIVALETERVVGTCRILVEGEVARLGRMAIASGDRRRGIGRALLGVAKREARAAGATKMTLHAQTSVAGLYASAGFTPLGEPFEEEGIEHVAMELALA